MVILYLYYMKIVITESQLQNLFLEWGSDDMDFRSTHKIGNRSVDKLNKGSIGGSLSSGKPWTEHPKYKSIKKVDTFSKKEEERERKKEELLKQKEIEWDVRWKQEKENQQKDDEIKSKNKEELDRIKNDERLHQYQYVILSILSKEGKVNGEMKINDLVNSGKMEESLVKHIMDKIQRHHEKMISVYRKFDKYKAKDIVNSYMEDGLLSSDIVKYIRLFSTKLR